MPLAKRWSAFNKINVKRISNKYGVYELGNVSDILYIEEGYIFAHLMVHFVDGSDPIPGASLYRVEYTGSKLRAQQRQNFELASYYRKHRRYPRFNQRKGRLRNHFVEDKTHKPHTVEKGRSKRKTFLSIKNERYHTFFQFYESI